MATFIILFHFTDQGIRNVKGSPDRADAFKAMAGKLGVTVKDFYWTVGHYDAIAIVEGPDEAVTTALLSIGSVGNVRTETLRAFSAEEISRIITNIP